MPGWGEPAGGRVARDRRDLRRRTDLVALRAQRPQARRPALRLQARLAGPAARGRRRAGWTARPRWSATGTSAPPTTTSSTSTQFTKSTHVTPPERAAFQAFLDDGYAEVTRAARAGLHLLGLLPPALRARPRAQDRLRARLAPAGLARHRRLHRPRRARPAQGTGRRPTTRRSSSTSTERLTSRRRSALPRRAAACAGWRTTSARRGRRARPRRRRRGRSRR